MTNPFTCNDLLSTLHQRIEQLPDHRRGKNTQYSISDAAVGAFGIFLTQSPSFLDYQRTLQHTKGNNNAHTLLGVAHMPCDNQVRKLLDPLTPSALDEVFLTVLAGLAAHGRLRPLRVLNDQLLIALDGTQYFSSQTIHCPNCLTRHTPKGHTLYCHAAITPVVVCPGRPQVLVLPPEYIMPQDGHEKQDCERAAGKRWLTKHAPQVAPYGVTVLGDDLYSNQPLCALALQEGYNFIFVCKPDSHPKFYERLAFWHANDGMAALEHRHWNGRCTEVMQYRYAKNVLLRGGDDALGDFPKRSSPIRL